MASNAAAGVEGTLSSDVARGSDVEALALASGGGLAKSCSDLGALVGLGEGELTWDVGLAGGSATDSATAADLG